MTKIRPDQIRPSSGIGDILKTVGANSVAWTPAAQALNLAANPSFERGQEGWGDFWGAGSYVIDYAAADMPHSGFQHVKMTLQTTDAYRRIFPNDAIAVTPGAEYEVWVWAQGAPGTRIETYIISAPTADGAAHFGTDSITTATGGAWQYNMTPTYARYGGRVTIPAGHYFARPHFLLAQNAGTTVPAILRVDDVEFSRAMAAGAGGGVGSGDGMDLSGPNDYGFGAVASSLPSPWAWDQQGGSSYSEAYGRGVLRIAPASFTYMRGIYRPLPSPFNTALMRWSGIPGVGNEGPGLCLRQGSTGKLLTWTHRASGAINLTAISAANGTVGSDTSTTWAAGPFTDWYTMIRQNSSTSWDFLWGPSPTNLETVFGAVNPGTYVGTFTPDQIGLYFLCLGGGIKVASMDYLKFT